MPEIRNPNLQNQGPGGGSSSGGDMRSTLIFTAVMVVALLGYQYFFKPKPAPPAANTQVQSQQAQPAAQPAQAASTQSGQPQSASGVVQAVAVIPTVAAAAETETTIENELYSIVFTNRGAQIKHWVLKKYFDSAGKPLDLVQPQASAQFGLPLSLYTYEPALTSQLNQALYQVSASGVRPSATGHALAPETSALTFHYAANGVDVVKTVRFDSSYVLSIEAQVNRNGVPVRSLLQWPAGLGDMEEFLPAGSKNALTRNQVPTSASSLFAWSIDGKQDSQPVAKVGNNATFDQPYAYAAVADLYFAAAFMPVSPGICMS